jgi:hypothetical protein
MPTMADVMPGIQLKSCRLTLRSALELCSKPAFSWNRLQKYFKSGILSSKLAEDSALYVNFKQNTDLVFPFFYFLLCGQERGSTAFCTDSQILLPFLAFFRNKWQVIF